MDYNYIQVKKEKIYRVLVCTDTELEANDIVELIAYRLEVDKEDLILLQIAPEDDIYGEYIPLGDEELNDFEVLYNRLYNDTINELNDENLSLEFPFIVIYEFDTGVFRTILKNP